MVGKPEVGIVAQTWTLPHGDRLKTLSVLGSRARSNAIHLHSNGLCLK